MLAFDLGAGLSQVTLIDGTVVRGVDVLSDVRANDLMVAFSFRRYRRDTVEIARRFVEAGGELVAVTDFEDAPLAEARRPEHLRRDRERVVRRLADRRRLGAARARDADHREREGCATTADASAIG